MKETYETGLHGEAAAKEYLVREKKMVFLEQRYRSKAGEIDLILLDGNTVVFCEVKTRNTGSRGNGLSAVNRAKQTRITKAAVIYLMQKKWMNRTVRFDIIEVYEEEILHIPNAFQPYGRFYH